jgi:hypothetical protein
VRDDRPDQLLEQAGRTDGNTEAACVENRRVWAAILLALDVDTCVSILSGRRVIASNLDGLVLRRALRDGRLPRADSFVLVTAEMLDAVAEAGPVPKR